MKFNLGLQFKKSLHPIEITALVIFALYLVFPVKTPAPLAKIMNSIVGVLIVIGVTAYLFLNTHPAVAILYIFVAYELIRRSGKTDSSSFVPNTQTKVHVNTYENNNDNNIFLSQPEIVEETSENTLSNYDDKIVTQPIDQIDHNYAQMGENSKVVVNERAAELARLNPPSPYGTTLEEDVIRVLAPDVASRLHTAPSPFESSGFVPVYEKGSDGTFGL